MEQKKKIDSELVFRHDADTASEAYGFSDSEFEAACERGNKMLAADKLLGRKVSQVVEEIMSLPEREQALFIHTALQKHLKMAEMFQQAKGMAAVMRAVGSGREEPGEPEDRTPEVDKAMFG